MELRSLYPSFILNYRVLNPKKRGPVQPFGPPPEYFWKDEVRRRDRLDSPSVVIPAWFSIIDSETSRGQNRGNWLLMGEFNEEDLFQCL